MVEGEGDEAEVADEYDVEVVGVDEMLDWVVEEAEDVGFEDPVGLLRLDPVDMEPRLEFVGEDGVDEDDMNDEDAEDMGLARMGDDVFEGGEGARREGTCRLTCICFDLLINNSSGCCWVNNCWGT
jgi:hypothetical protein